MPSCNLQQWWDITKGVLLVGTLVFSGFALGYHVADSQGDAKYTQELERIRSDYALALQVITDWQGLAADRIDAAAETAQRAASTAERVADEASKGRKP